MWYSEFIGEHEFEGVGGGFDVREEFIVRRPEVVGEEHRTEQFFPYLEVRAELGHVEGCDGCIALHI